MSSQFLSMTASDDGAGHGSWEAMASVRPAQREAALAEVQALLAAAAASAPGPRGPEEEGGAWDAELLERQEDGGWMTITLSLAGPWAWGEALRQRFDPEDPPA